MRYATAWIGHGRGQVDEFYPVPVQIHQYLAVKTHALVHVVAANLRTSGRHRVNAEAAHAVLDVGGQGVNPHPDVGGVAAVKARFGNRGIENRLAYDHVLRVLLGLRHKAWHVWPMVLAIGIHLQHMAPAQGFGL